MDPTQAPAAPQEFGFSSILSSAWDTALGTFNRWVDNEFGAELALAADSDAAEQAVTLEQAPQTSGFPGDLTAAQVFGIPVLWLVGGAAALVLLLVVLRR